MDLCFTVEHQHIKRTDDNYVVAGSRNYLYANFTFTKEWNENIIAIFASKCGTYAQLLKDGRCLVPYEALKRDGRIDVSVCAGDLITSDTAGFIVHETGYTEDTEKSITPPPTILSDIYERIEKAFINAKTEALQEVSDVLGNYLKLTDVDSDLVYGSSNPVASGAVYNKFQSEIDRRMHLDYVKADKEHNGGFIGGAGASLGGAGGAAIGAKAKASSGMAGGSGASASEGMACGKNAYASHGAAAGRNSKTLHGAALGDGAKTVDNKGNPITAVQLGTGVNKETNTVQFFSYKFMNVDGSIPNERIPKLNDLEQRILQLERSISNENQ